ncbi:GNAT family N-acetyltransferase [Lederbergia wuyishanensis]|uniref:GNAT superfamily N-acetyltransferase n=1 Tax=Lederbergia wuyishanensis TaxID=1347903 RepID=A0ABU0D6Q1_9BACI|nr:GNAT family N-acetyltransferase [Lederbergia wuyishanensis]MCJ8008548.1 GNAT family N-acetyltransferase [Lederbergia wuyishanensis]MDQ0344038.1 GNAT superfamily N-acetyltransferase [Lederbergia wuyishanensis]
MDLLKIRNLLSEDCEIISKAFAEQGWNKPVFQYERYLSEQKEGVRKILVAEYDNQFSGYLTIKWESDYASFGSKGIPEIVDLNVLIKYRKKGVATSLMDEAERIVSEKYDSIGIGFGLTSDYGAAQRIYVKRGYIPDGLGVSQNGKFLTYGDKITVDDDLVLYLTKTFN